MSFPRIIDAEGTGCSGGFLQDTQAGRRGESDEVNPVVKALTSNNIAVTAIRSHMLHETPRFFFLHFWGYDEPEKLAKGLKEALDKTNSKK